MFLSKNKKNNVYPCKPQFYYIKMGFKGVKIIWACFRDGGEIRPNIFFAMLNSAEHDIFLLITIKLLTLCNSYLLNIANNENFSANKQEKANYC